jgi:hypothetical protein
MNKKIDKNTPQKIQKMFFSTIDTKRPKNSKNPSKRIKIQKIP